MPFCDCRLDSIFKEKFERRTAKSSKLVRIGSTFARWKRKIKSAFDYSQSLKIHLVFPKPWNVDLWEQRPSQSADGSRAGEEQGDSTGWE